MHQGNILWQVGQIAHAIIHREGQFHDISLLPLTTDGNIRRRTCYDIDGLTIHLHFEGTRLHPTRKAHLQCELSLTLDNGNLAVLRIRKSRLLT